MIPNFLGLHMRLRITAAVGMFVIVWAASLEAQANPAQVALKRWYSANQATTFPLQGSPAGIVFDGTNIWVVLNSIGSIAKYRPSDGALLGSYKVTSSPSLIAFDGANLWVTDASNGKLLKVRPNDGAILATVTLSGAYGIVFDGLTIWVSNYTSIVTRIRVSDGLILSGWYIACNVSELAIDGANLWGTCPQTNQVFKMPSNGGNFSLLTVGNYEYGLVFDGANMWVANDGDGTITKIHASDMQIVGTYSSGFGAGHLVFDGTNIWVSNTFANTLSKFRASDATYLGSFPAPTFPQQLAFDGANVWVASLNASALAKF